MEARPVVLLCEWVPLLADIDDAYSPPVECRVSGDEEDLPLLPRK